MLEREGLFCGCCQGKPNWVGMQSLLAGWPAQLTAKLPSW